MPIANDDPFESILKPPVDETPEARAVRLEEESRARLTSERIDASLREEKAALAKVGRQVKILLLGQSESGKSTTLKNFQLLYAPAAFRAERLAWRAVIQLNLIRSVNTILDVLARELMLCSASSKSRSPISGSSIGHGTDPGDADIGFDTFSDDDDVVSRSNALPKLSPLPFTEQHRILKLRLGPLKRIELDLQARLGSASTATDDWSMGYVSSSGDPFDSATLDHAKGALSSGIDGARARRSRRPKEFFVHANAGWKSQSMPASPTGSDDESATRLKPRQSSSHGHSRNGTRDGDGVTEVLASCREDIRTLWEDDLVKQSLRRRAVHIEEKGGFFLDDSDRIATRSYEPSDDDIVRARLRTVGVQEHRLVFESGKELGSEWLMYDVGGSRTSRAAWLPYFSDLTALIFLAPISAFNETLTEDKRVNRLEDTFVLWRSVCASDLLRKVNLLVLLNKKDLLEHKISNGVHFTDFVTSYGSRPNEASHIAKYLRDKFKDILKTQSPEPRPFYCYPTSVVDTKATAVTIGTVKAGIVRDHLREADLL